MDPMFWGIAAVVFIFATAFSLDQWAKRSERNEQIQNAVENYEEWELPQSFIRARLDKNKTPSKCGKCGMDDERIVYLGNVTSLGYC